MGDLTVFGGGDEISKLAQAEAQRLYPLSVNLKNSRTKSDIAATAAGGQRCNSMQSD
jgi:hypothetical protein